VKEFINRFADRAEAGDTAAMIRYRSGAPHAPETHPTEDQLLPFFAALGASELGQGRRDHAATRTRALALNAYAFDWCSINQHRTDQQS
jgi:4,5-DOPA dioxygenase extradiol